MEGGVEVGRTFADIVGPSPRGIYEDDCAAGRRCCRAFHEHVSEIPSSGFEDSPIKFKAWRCCTRPNCRVIMAYR